MKTNLLEQLKTTNLNKRVTDDFDVMGCGVGLDLKNSKDHHITPKAGMFADTFQLEITFFNRFSANGAQFNDAMDNSLQMFAAYIYSDIQNDLLATRQAIYSGDKEGAFKALDKAFQRINLKI